MQYYSPPAERCENYPRNINASDRLILVITSINSMVWHPNRVFSLLCFVKRLKADVWSVSPSSEPINFLQFFKF